MFLGKRDGGGAGSFRHRALTLFRHQLGQAEIHDLGLAPLGHEDIGGFDIAVDDAFGMRRVQGIGDLNTKVQQIFQLQRLPAEALLQGSSSSVTRKGRLSCSPMS